MSSSPSEPARGGARRLRRAAALVASALLDSCLGACAGAMRGERSAALATDWLDLKKTTARDTSVWRLAADGADLTVHVVVSDSSESGAATVTRVSGHGSWFLRGALDDTAHRALCFNKRPGRSAPSCIRFTLDTLSDGTRRLHLRGYRGTHEVKDRELVERR